MKNIRDSLTARIFFAIVATSLLVVAIMASMIAFNMREGFSRYLLQGEINRFDDVALALGELEAQSPHAWERFRNRPDAWKSFIRMHFRPLLPPPALPDPYAGTHHAPQPEGKDNPFQFSDRSFLLDSFGTLIIAGRDQGSTSVTRPLYRADGRAVIGYLGLSAPELGVEGTDAFFLRGQYNNLLLAAAIAFVLSALVAVRVSRGLLAPIKALELGARNLSSGKYSARIPNRRSDELGELIRHYNTLAESLELSEAAERQWISNTSHELQTPLAVLRAEIEALQDGIRQPDERTLTEMHSSVMRLSKLVNDLKDLSFAREGRLLTVVEAHDLGDIAREAVNSMSVRAKAANIQLSTNVDQALIAVCDGDRIRQVIDNILENAIRYTSAPGRVIVSGSRVEGAVRLGIEDTPPSLPSDVLPHLFERFYRGDASRSRISGGTGLGLSICESIVHAHGGRITARNSALGGLLVEFELPIPATETGPSH